MTRRGWWLFLALSSPAATPVARVALEDAGAVATLTKRAG